ncbi:MAG: hypothetical protein IJS31_03220 [Oscillospiraceae bacterium]|nr:hypothetical protein [Oscillospiraceae bacterium]
MDYLKKALCENEDLWRLPLAGEAARQAVFAPPDAAAGRAAPPHRAWKRAAQAAQAAQARQRETLLQTAEQTHTLALQMARTERLSAKEIVRRTEERGHSSGSFSHAAAQTVSMPEAQSMEEISRFFERDARRYG